MGNKNCCECRFYDEQNAHCERFECMALPDWRCGDFECRQKPTNGDIVRQLSYDDFAEFLTEPKCGKCIYYDRNNYGACTVPKDKTCADGIEAWLNAPAYAPDINVGTKESEGKYEL